MSALGGRLVGYGIETNGVVDYHWLDTPKHNMIVKSGIEHLLRFGGDDLAEYNPFNDTVPSDDEFIAEAKKVNLWVGKIDSPRVHHGALNYCAYGSGDKDTEWEDTDLQNRIAITEDRYTGYTYNGNQFIKSGSNVTGIKYRISHKFPAVSGVTTIKELGWFGKAGADEDSAKYVMFARVKLDEELVLTPDQSLIVTYDLTDNRSTVTIPSGMIATSSAGTGTLYPIFISNKTDNSWDQVINFNSISASGYASAATYKQVKMGTSLTGDGTQYLNEFPAWARLPPSLWRINTFYTHNSTNAKENVTKVNFGTSTSTDGWPSFYDGVSSRYQTIHTDTTNFIETASKYIDGSLYRIKTVPNNTTVNNTSTTSGTYGSIIVYNSYFYFMPLTTLYWMTGARKISYTTDA